MAEYRAIRSALPGDHVRINSTKSLIGHLLGAAGAVEAVATVQAMQSGNALTPFVVLLFLCCDSFVVFALDVSSIVCLAMPCPQSCISDGQAEVQSSPSQPQLVLCSHIWRQLLCHGEYVWPCDMKDAWTAFILKLADLPKSAISCYNAHCEPVSSLQQHLGDNLKGTSTHSLLAVLLALVQQACRLGCFHACAVRCSFAGMSY